MDCNDAPDFMPDLDDWTQRLKENPTDSLEEIRQEFEGFLTQLEALAVQAIATNDWDAFYQHLIEFQSEHDLHGITGIAIEEEAQMNQSQTKQEMQAFIEGKPVSREFLTRAIHPRGCTT
jgi:hypothetical protein